MKFIIYALLYVSFIVPDLANIRKMYVDVAKSESNSKYFLEKMTGVSDSDDNILLAYKAASVLIYSRFEKKIKDKISSFKEAAKMLETTVYKEPENIEIRMIRLSIQENTPAITGYKKNIEEDKAYIIRHYHEQNKILKEYLRGFVLQSRSFSEKEKQFLK